MAGFVVDGPCQMGLADARFAFEEKQLPAAVGNGVEAGRQHAQFALTSDQRRARSCDHLRLPKRSRMRVGSVVVARQQSVGRRARSVALLRVPVGDPAARAPRHGIASSTTAVPSMVAVSVIGAPSTSHNTAGWAPCHRTASDSRESGPAIRPWASKSIPRHRGGMPPGNNVVPASKRRSTAGITATSTGQPCGAVTVVPMAVRPRSVPQACQVGERPVFAGGCQHERRRRRATASRRSSSTTGGGGDRGGNLWHRGGGILAVEVTEADEFPNAEQMTFRLGVRIVNTGEKQLAARRS